MRFPSSYYGQISPGQLFGRGDVCDEAYPNEGAYSKTCTPGNTPCCYRKGQAFPRCVNSGGAGWCCDGTGSSTCFVDQNSACEEPDAVTCTNLARGAKKACCPKKTKCDDVFEASEDGVRCQMEFDDLAKLAAGNLGLALASTESLTVTVSATGGSTGGSMTGIAQTSTSHSSTVSSSGGAASLASTSSSSSPTPATGVSASSSPSGTPSTTPSNTTTTDPSVSSFWKSKGGIVSVALCVAVFLAFIVLLIFGLQRQRNKKKAQRIRAMTRSRSLPRGAYLPERPVYAPLAETEDHAAEVVVAVAEMSSTPAEDNRQRQQREVEMRPPSYYAVGPKDVPPSRGGGREDEDEDELAELDDTQIKSVLNGEGP
ncbi:hypothetical protein SMACR_08645 [Sordaria macrospora]|uniref:WGS project CABT00000000 data, contig 2.61 n=2 Tax=Sordaria macrospora TaxID=5147 RepID=F7WAG5_SORMK|nr:uncharacterized protein SMAC_08645 [Sordaria macrospora k-hell]KAA8629713.1 hypothetical protein SMACR_08645 [Sordaria macrospora]WPJ65219.1 hypothetical protein SMAC4_08645 [Sordaria macrospora]CCC05330.1 unnamed protein product [Sordaria macrospora k-hell]